MPSNLWAFPRRGGVVVLYAVTIFLSAFLLFALQPIIAKVILPWFGGTAAVWTTCLLFFQALLLAGYGYSHLTTRYLSPRAQAVLHVALLALSLASLPILPDASWKPTPEGDPLERILLLLLVSVGPAYGMLSTTGPLLQAWFARELPGSVPYRLFALSNFGSMLALLGYPFGFEPLLPVGAQSLAFSVGYVVFALACSAIALRQLRQPQHGKSQPRASVSTAWGATAPPLRWTQLVEWIAWAALASALLLALTSDLTQNVAPIPLLWVLPLAIYLLSFILCFEGSAWYQRPLFIVGALAGLTGIAYGMQPQYYHLWVPASITLHCLALFAICMVCHGELARKKPDPQHLTTFYLMVAVGGVTGGLFAGLVAPYAFNGDWELPLVLVAVAAMIAWSLLRDPIAALRLGGARLALPAPAQVLVAGGTAVAVLGLAVYSVYLVLTDAKLLVRNFYGTLRLEERAEDDPASHSRLLYHGTIIHGFQFLNGEWRYQPTSYFTTGSGVGVGIAATQTRAPHRVGVIGLGAGTLAAYARKGDHLTFYEINPLVEDIARAHFTYLGDTPGKVDVRLGDARLVLEREAPQGYDTFVVDAFSGDAIPIHLLTLEAFQLYFRHLKPDGVLAVHVSNKRLDLAPIVALAADTLGKHAWLIDTDDDDDENAYGSTWVLVFNRADRLSDVDVPDGTQVLTRPDTLRAWTDDYSSLFPILR